jgi:hypothetical protein
MRIVTEFSTGLARLGERTFAPQRFSVRFEFPEDQDVSLEIEIRDGRPECSAIQIRRGAGQPALTGDELRRLPLTNWVQVATEQVTHVLTGPGKLSLAAERDFDEVRADVGRSVRRRYPLDRARLEEVAHAYRQNPRAEAVAAALFVSRSQAYRLIAEAKRRRLIPDTEEGSAGGEETRG